MKKDLLLELMKWELVVLGGAIPSNLARSVSKELAENGFISRCWTGLGMSACTRSQSRNGLLVAGIIEDSPADDAGFKPGDIIKIYDGKKVSARIAEDLPIFNQLSYGMNAGKKVKISGLQEEQKNIVGINHCKTGIRICKRERIKKLGHHDS